MPKSKKKDSPKQQRERFEKAVEELSSAGELDPIEAAAALDDMVKRTKGKVSSD